MITRNSLYKVANYIKLNNLYNLLAEEMLMKTAASNQAVKALQKAYGTQFVQRLRGLSKAELQKELFRVQNGANVKNKNDLTTFLSSLLGGKHGNMDGFHTTFGVLEGVKHGPRVRPNKAGIIPKKRSTSLVPLSGNLNAADTQFHNFLNNGVTFGPNFDAFVEGVAGSKVGPNNLLTGPASKGSILPALLGLGGAGAGAAGLGGLLYYNNKKRKDR